MATGRRYLPDDEAPTGPAAPGRTSLLRCDDPACLTDFLWPHGLEREGPLGCLLTDDRQEVTGAK
jgi:hypothetical protein